jgi:uncharacterized protein (TIGR02001 family)
MKKTTLALAMGLMISGAANAALEANIGATSNYLWRGQSQSSDSSVLSGGMDYSAESGVYAGVWTSSLGSTGGEELDLYAGISGESAGVGYDLGIINYRYPSATDGDFTEVAASVSKDAFTAGVNYTFDAEASSAGTDGDVYYYVSASTEIMDGFSGALTVGRYNFDGSSATTDWTHTQLDISKSVEGFADITFSLSKAGIGSGDDELIPFVSLSKSF